MYNNRRNSYNSRGDFRPRKRFSRATYSQQELIRAITRMKQEQTTPTKESIAVDLTHQTFQDFPLNPTLLQTISKKGYSVPTPIQDQAISSILEGKDVIGIANTGTGKTAAFLIPIIEKIAANRTEKACILAPTRELALQIYEELVALAHGLGVYGVLCIGGMSLGRQRNELQRNPNIVIGTPGRIKDLLQQRVLSLSKFSMFVLDEADRMVDIGFIQEIKYFISLLPQQRQSLFFSATISGKIQELLHSFVHSPVTISVKKTETTDHIHQEIIKVVNKQTKVDQLHDLLIHEDMKKVLIFGRTKWGIQRLTEDLITRGFKAEAIHGNKSQNQRQRTLDRFKRSDIHILLATDVASRGLDISNISHVINYDLPDSYEDYIHRIGRTGRAEKQGKALTFVE